MRTNVLITPHRFRICALWFVASLGGLGCASATFSADRETLFGRAVEAGLEEEWAESAGHAHAFRQASSVDDERYDRSQLLLAKALAGLELRYAAALFYLDVARSGRSPELINRAVVGLQRLMLAPGYHDAPWLVAALGSSELSGLRPEQAAFLGYLQGLDSLRHGLDTWAQVSFSEIAQDSAEYHRASYVLAVAELAAGQHKAGGLRLRKLLKEKKVPATVRQEVQIALARLAMEQGRYGDASTMYSKLRGRFPERPDLMLELAWAYYYQGEPRRALGLLLALDAPVYQGLIAPERYLLEARCLRRLCQFEPARIAAARLLRQYGPALRDLHEGVRPEDSESIRLAARRRGLARDAARWTEALSLESEQAAEQSGELGEALAGALAELYARGVREAKRREALALRGELVALTDELVTAQDGVRLILHELSVGMLRGRQRPGGAFHDLDLAQLAASDTTNYAFDGEFWTDELDDLVVTIEDRCLLE